MLSKIMADIKSQTYILLDIFNCTLCISIYLTAIVAFTLLGLDQDPETQLPRR